MEKICFPCVEGMALKVLSAGLNRFRPDSAVPIQMWSALCAKAHDRASDRPFAKASALLGISTHEYLVERYQAMIDNAHHHVAEFIAIKLVH